MIKTTRVTCLWMLAIVLVSITFFKPTEAYADRKSRITSLVKQLESSDKATRRLASQKLLTMYPQHVIPHIISSLNNKDDYVVQNLLVLIGASKDKRLVPQLVKLLKRKSVIIKARATQILGRFNEPGVDKELLKMMKDKSSLVREAAAYAFNFKIGSIAQQGKILALKDKDPAVKLAILKSPAGLPFLRHGNGEEKVDKAISELFNDPNFSVRLYAINRFTAKKYPAIVPQLRTLTKDKNPQIRGTAMLALVNNSPDKVTQKIVVSALYDKSEHVQNSAISAMTVFRDPKSVPTLIKFLKTKPEKYKRLLIPALGHQNDIRVVPHLIEELANKHKVLRDSAIYELRNIKGAETEALLFKALKDKRQSVREGIERVFSRRLRLDTPPHKLQAMLNIDNEKVKAVIMYSLGQTRHKPAVASLISKLDDSSESVRTRAVFALAEINTAESIKALTDRLQDKSYPEKRAIVLSFIEAVNPNTVASLIAAHDDKDSGVREAVAKALGSQKDIRAIPVLEKMLAEDKSKTVQELAAKSIAKIKPASLYKYVRHSNKHARSYAIQSMATNSSPEAVDHIIQALTDNDASVRYHAMNTLGKLKAAKAVKPLLARVMVEKTFPGGAAVNALAKIGTKEAINGLIKALKDPKVKVKVDIAYSLSLKSAGPKANAAAKAYKQTVKE